MQRSYCNIPWDPWIYFSSYFLRSSMVHGGVLLALAIFNRFTHSCQAQSQSKSQSSWTDLALILIITTHQISSGTAQISSGTARKVSHCVELNILPSSVPVPVPVKFNWTEIALLSLSSHPPDKQWHRPDKQWHRPPTRECFFQFTQEAEIWYAS